MFSSPRHCSSERMDEEGLFQKHCFLPPLHPLCVCFLGWLGYKLSTDHSIIPITSVTKVKTSSTLPAFLPCVPFPLFLPFLQPSKKLTKQQTTTQNCARKGDHHKCPCPPSPQGINLQVSSTLPQWWRGQALLTDPGCHLAPWPTPADPPTSQRFPLKKKRYIIKEARNGRPILVTHTLFGL